MDPAASSCAGLLGDVVPLSASALNARLLTVGSHSQKLRTGLAKSPASHSNFLPIDHEMTRRVLPPASFHHVELTRAAHRHHSRPGFETSAW